MFQFTAPPPLSLYIHVPWCVQKCPYCDFNSHALRDTLPEQAYVDALLADLEQELPEVWGRRVESVFIGGGTPSLLSAEALERLLSGVRARLPQSAAAEITLEANPGTVEAGRFREFRATGINRLSIGIQSFHDAQLQALGRIHDRAQAIAAVEAAHAAGFDNFNLDLMFGLPGQDVAGAQQDVATAVALSPTHLSYYQLTIEPNTAFHHAPPVLPEEEALWQIQEAGHELLAAAGFAQYEVSAFARDGFRCRHNLNYWHFGDYLGIGAGAHGKITHAPQQRIERRWKKRHPADYLDSAHSGERIAGSNNLTRDEAAFEFMMNALRLTEGFETALFAERTGLAITQVQTKLARAQQKGFIDWTMHAIRPTALGRNYLNELLGMFLDD